MKQRVLSALIGLVLFFTILAFFDTIVPNIAIALIAGLAIWELLNAAGCTKNRYLSVLSIAFGFAVPFLSFTFMMHHLMLISLLYIGGLFALLLRFHETLHIRDVAIAFMFSLLIPFSLTSLLYLRDRYGAALGVFYTLLTFGSAWLSDSCAYFAGRYFGKRKLAPQISPKKTIEGAIGGVLGGTLTATLLLWMTSLLLRFIGTPIHINYLLLLVMLPFLSLISIVGDLAASVIKRQYGVKDYGSIMPGHGGVVDRFDSVLLVAPAVFLICRYMPLAVPGLL